MSSLRKKMIASLMILSILFSHSINVFASVEDNIINNEETMNNTEESYSNSDETMIIPEETSGSEEILDTNEESSEETNKENLENISENEEKNTDSVEEKQQQLLQEESDKTEKSEEESNIVEENTLKRSVMLNTTRIEENEEQQLRASGAASFNQDSQYISITKTFSGITSNQIPSDFSITVGNYQLTCNRSNPYFKSVSSDGLVWNWRIEGVSGGTYNFTENGEMIDGYNVTTSPTKNSSVSVVASSIDITILKQDRTCNHTDWDVEDNFIFAGSLTKNGGTVVITQKALSSAQRDAVKQAIRNKASSNLFNKEPYYFFSIEKQGNSFTIGNSHVTYNGSACIFESTSMWQHVIRGTLTQDPGQSADISISNNYTTTQKQVTVEKAWINADGSTNAPSGASVEFTLYANGNETDNKIILDGQADEYGETTSWKATFSNLDKLDAAGNEISYTVSETKGYEGYVSSTNNPVSDGGRIINTFIYTATGTAQISASKELTGGTLQADQFSFVLTDETGTEVETVKNDVQGNINFSEITYNQDQIGTHTYTITEVNDGAEGYTYDTKTITVTVEVTDNGNGTLSTNVSYSTDPVFTNSYEQQARATATIEVTKRLNGATLQEGQFTFELKDNSGATVATAKNDAEGRVRFNVGLNNTGMYTYRVTEVNDGAAGYTYDTSTLNVMVLVTGFGGRLTANTIYLGNRTFTNTYTARGTATIEASKVLDGRTLEDGQFTFALRNRYGMPVQTTRNDANGNVSFNVSYTQNDVGTHTYTIAERNDRARGYTYDSKTVTVTVEVTDNGNGTLSTNVTYNPDDTVFTNTYRAEGTATIEVSKVLDGRTLEDGQFSFTLTDETGTPVETVQNDADGKVSFSTITFNQYEVGTHTYTITEARGRARGYTYDTKTITATVEVTDNGNGTLSTDVTYSPDGVFNNTYRANGNARIEVTKRLTGRTLTQNQFSFELKDEEGTTLETVRNDLLGRVRFSRINYNQYEVGTHTYTITEVNGGAPGYTYDTKTITATVEVTDNGNGTLSTNVTYSPNSIFNNVYSAEGTAVIELTKQLDGRELEEGQFNFVARDLLGRTVATATNDAQGRVRFEINYDETDTGIHMYRITEVNDRAPGYTYDRNTITVTVIANDNGRGTINTNVIYGFNRTFNNTYRAEGTAQISVSKELEGLELHPDQFSFVLKDEEGNEIETVTNDAEGQVVFSELSYNQYEVGTHTYTITEVDDGVIGFIYDSKVIEVTVEVTDNGDGTLSTNVSYSDEVFTNIYERVDVNVGAVWNDKDNEFRYRPESIVVRLYANGVEIDHAIVRESDGWKCVFVGLDKYLDGKKVNYTISEDKFFGYIPTIHKNAENDYTIIHDLAPIGGGDPSDFVVAQPVSNVHLMNPRTGAYDHVAICIALSIASMCTMIVATKKYNNSKNK